MVAMARRRLLQLLTCCVVLTFVWCPTSFARASRLSTAFQSYSRDDESSDSKPLQSFRAQLVHRDHPDSPLRPPTRTSVSERLAAAAGRSEARAARARRRLGAAATNASEIHDLMPISPGGGEYLITIHLGTPPQKFTVIVDSGSDLVWVQCLPCKSPNVCFPAPNPFFNPTASTTFSTVPCNSSLCDPNQFQSTSCVNDSSRACEVSQTYSDGSSIAGRLSLETLSLRNSLSGVAWETPDVVFGCMNNDTATFGSDAVVDGLAGFGRGPNSLPSQLTQFSLNNVFSYCLVPFASSTALTSSMEFGVSGGKASYGLPIVYTPILTHSETYHWVNMTGITVNGKAVDVKPSTFVYNATSGDGGVIFDSGTTNLYLQYSMWTAVVKEFNDSITYPHVDPAQYGHPLCYNLTGVEQPRLPTMSLQFAGMNGSDTVEFPLARQNLFVPVSSEGVECLAISTVYDDTSTMFIGNIAQADHYVEYDVTNLRLGWTTSVDCSVPIIIPG